MTSSNWTVVTPTSEKQACTTDQIIFLAGPIQGARDWQREAIGHLGAEIDHAHDVYERVPHIFIANPRRAEKFTDGDDEAYEKQVSWERSHLSIARHRGVVMFWLAAESYHHCSRAYAQTTRFELGESIALWTTSNNPTALVIGCEEGFTGARYVRRVVNGYRAHGLSVCDDLRKTCARAVVRMSGVRW